jgi:glycosyltransferase involved in cell wall biosynthesis
MMHVLVVSPHLPPNFFGGVEVYSDGLVRALRARGRLAEAVAVEHIAQGPADGCEAVTNVDSGYPTHRLALTIAHGRSFPLLSRHKPAEDWFEAHLNATRPEVVHVQSGYLLGAAALLAARRAGVPTVLTLHDYWFACPRVTLQHPSGEICSGPERPSKCAWCLSSDRRRYQLIDRLTGNALSRNKDRSRFWQVLVGGSSGPIVERQSLFKSLLESADVVLAPTRFVANQVASIGFPPDRIRESRCGMPPLTRRGPRAIDTLRLSFIGQVAPHKGVHLLVEAVRSLAGRPIALNIHGPLTPYPDYVRHLRQIAGQDPRITFRGPYQREALPGLFAESDVLVAPSVWHEVAALVIQEAQASGVPVIVSRLGGSPELVTDNVDGLHFDPAAPGELAARIVRLLDEPGLLARLAAAAPRPRTIDDEVDALLAIYESVRRAS